VKIGDLGLAAIVDKTHVAHTILGTPEFMAPELYTETYTESVDIYSYGMCVLEMVTREVPYAECSSVVQIFHNVTRGVPPAALKRLKDPELRGFIERCIGQPRNRPSAAELLQDPFFNGIRGGEDDDALADASRLQRRRRRARDVPQELRRRPRRAAAGRTDRLLLPAFCFCIRHVLTLSVPKFDFFRVKYCKHSEMA